MHQSYSLLPGYLNCQPARLYHFVRCGYNNTQLRQIHAYEIDVRTKSVVYIISTVGFVGYLITYNMISGAYIIESFFCTDQHLIRSHIGRIIFLTADAPFQPTLPKTASPIHGRKEKLAVFINSKGVDASAKAFSLVETAKSNKLNVYAYLNYLLLYMLDMAYRNEPWMYGGYDALSRTSSARML